MHTEGDPVELSVVIPVYNEEENVPLLHGELCAVLGALDRRCEVVWVDDGSTDGTFAALATATAAPCPANCRIQLIQLTRNCGQSLALAVGLRAATGRLIATMDGDLQNDPADLPRLLAALTEDVDIVTGWRRQRRDRLWSRRLPSAAANWALRRITHVPVHDLGCAMRIARKSALDRVPLYGDRHRYLVPLAAAQGAVVREIEVHHRPRSFGKSKYGLKRTIHVLIDAVSLRFYVRFWQRPLHLFGGLGLTSGGAGLLICGYLSYLKLVKGLSIGSRPLLLLGVLLLMLGAQFFCFGLLAEIQVHGQESRRTLADDPIRRRHIVEPEQGSTDANETSGGFSRTSPPCT